MLVLPLTLHRVCTGNGSFSKASLQASVRQTIVSNTSDISICLTIAAALYSVGGIRATFTIGVGAGGPAAYWCVGQYVDI